MKVKVNEGFTVDNGKKMHQPGATLNLDDAEAKLLAAAGIISLAKISADELIEAISKAEDLEALKVLLPNGEKRKTVLDAYAAREAAIKAQDS